MNRARALAVTVAAALTIVPASASPARASCTQDVPVTHTPDQVQAHLIRTCGDRVRAIGDWAGKLRYGTYLLQGYSTACDNPPSCQGHPDGSLSWGGWQDRRTGKIHKTFSARTVPL